MPSYSVFYLGMAILAWCLCCAPTALAQTYRIDTTRTTLAFSATHMGVLTVEGMFRSFGGTIAYDADNPSAVVANVTIDVASIDTDHQRRDQSLRSAAFFDVDTYPQLGFRTTQVTASGEGVYEAEGVLVLWGQKRPIAFAFTLAHLSADDTVQLEGAATFTMSREALGLRFASAMDGLIGDEITVRLTIAATQER